MFINLTLKRLTFCLLIQLACCAASSGQITTTTFTYQGRLTDNLANADGEYDFRFTLFSGSGALGDPLSVEDVSVTKGIFTVTLDFGFSVFLNNTADSMEISVRPGASTGAYTILSPRQPITRAPYAIKSAHAFSADTATDATQLGGVPANQYVLTSDFRLIDPRPPIPGSPNYIQNNFPNSTSQQASSSFNIDGNGAVGGTFGIGTNSPGDRLQIVSGTADIRIGQSTGADGMEIRSSTTGHSPAIYLTNTGSNGRSYRIASFRDATNPGSFVIRDESYGIDRFTIDDGKFRLKYDTLNPNTGATNTGVLSFQDQSFSRISGITTEDFAQLINFGINTGREGSFSPSIPGYWFRADTRPGEEGLHFFKKAVTTGAESELMRIDESSGIVRARINSNSNAGLGLALNNQLKWSVATTTGGNFQIFNDAAGQNALAIDAATNFVSVNVLAPGGVQLCRNASNQISNCSSSLRYKTNINSFTPGLNLVKRLSPIRFDWKQDGLKDVGLAAEDVEKIEPLLVTYNDKGQVEGVKYDRIGVILINAVKEQQAQLQKQGEIIQTQQNELRTQRQLIAQQQSQIENLTRIFCISHPKARSCRSRR